MPNALERYRVEWLPTKRVRLSVALANSENERARVGRPPVSRIADQSERPSFLRSRFDTFPTPGAVHRSMQRQRNLQQLAAIHQRHRDRFARFKRTMSRRFRRVP
jgi:hypothetical protein